MLGRTRLGLAQDLERSNQVQVDELVTAFDVVHDNVTRSRRAEDEVPVLHDDGFSIGHLQGERTKRGDEELGFQSFRTHSVLATEPRWQMLGLLASLKTH